MISPLFVLLILVYVILANIFLILWAIIELGEGSFPGVVVEGLGFDVFNVDDFAISVVLELLF